MGIVRNRPSPSRSSLGAGSSREAIEHVEFVDRAEAEMARTRGK
jgi:hypothetical protein